MQFLQKFFKKDPKPRIKQALERAKQRHDLPELDEIAAVLTGVEQATNYATLVDLALETAAECRGTNITELKSAYMRFWWQWHNHQQEPEYRAKKLIIITAEAARVHPDDKIGWPLINGVLAWVDQGGPDRSDLLKTHFGEVPSLDEIRTFQGTA